MEKVREAIFEAPFSMAALKKISLLFFSIFKEILLSDPSIPINTTFSFEELSGSSSSFFKFRISKFCQVKLGEFQACVSIDHINIVAYVVKVIEQGFTKAGRRRYPQTKNFILLKGRQTS